MYIYVELVHTLVVERSISNISTSKQRESMILKSESKNQLVQRNQQHHEQGQNHIFMISFRFALFFHFFSPIHCHVKRVNRQNKDEKTRSLQMPKVKHITWAMNGSECRREEPENVYIQWKMHESSGDIHSVSSDIFGIRSTSYTILLERIYKYSRTSRHRHVCMSLSAVGQ